MATREVFVMGYPGDVGGANTECWHTVRLWRRAGLDVTLLPTWKADDRWRSRLEGIGCRTVQSSPARLAHVPRLPGAIVVAFCNSHFLRHASRLKAIGCRTVWVNCMTWLFAAERHHYRQWGPFDGYVFQSAYQHEQLGPRLARFGVRPEQMHRIRGAFCCEEFPFRPRAHAPGTALVIGRLSRDAPDKFAAHTWAQYAQVAPPRRVRILGWSRQVERKLGPPPDWAECLPPGAETPQQFLASLHCLVPLADVPENWPRCALEAMATGVPVVAEDRGGWREMIVSGQTGFLASSGEDWANQVNRLARDETLRLGMAHAARQRLQHELAQPEVIWAGWQRLFSELNR